MGKVPKPSLSHCLTTNRIGDIFFISPHGQGADMTSTTAKSENLLLRFRPVDSAYGVSRATVAKLAESLGCSETQVVHHALSLLAKEVLPAYEADDGELSDEQLAAIRKAEPQGQVSSVRSSLF
jgi:hypothetical protein